MSCIPKLLEMKGDQEYLKIGDVCVESGGNYKGYDYLVTFTYRGNRCGYVAIEPGHPLNKKENIGNYDIDLRVHGGVTFFDKQHLLEESDCGDLWIGFDAAHAGDDKETELAKKLFHEHNDLTRIFEKSLLFEGWTIKDNKYMEQECKNLIDQIASYNG